MLREVVRYSLAQPTETPGYDISPAFLHQLRISRLEIWRRCIVLEPALLATPRNNGSPIIGFEF